MRNLRRAGVAETVIMKITVTGPEAFSNGTTSPIRVTHKKPGAWPKTSWRGNTKDWQTLSHEPESRINENE